MNKYEYKGQSLLEDFQPCACVYFKKKSKQMYHHFYVDTGASVKSVSYPASSYTLEEAIYALRKITV